MLYPFQHWGSWLNDSSLPASGVLADGLSVPEFPAKPVVVEIHPVYFKL